jgi:uncharacterized protein involved in exopolysaccharide biosynthesis
MDQSAPDHPRDKDEIDIADLLRTLYHRRFTVVLVAAIGLAASVTTALVIPNVYRSEGSFSFQDLGSLNVDHSTWGHSA